LLLLLTIGPDCFPAFGLKPRLTTFPAAEPLLIGPSVVGFVFSAALLACLLHHQSPLAWLDFAIYAI
jgi:hypothetical protein